MIPQRWPTLSPNVRVIISPGDSSTLFQTLSGPVGFPSGTNRLEMKIYAWTGPPYHHKPRSAVSQLGYLEYDRC
jgi:hypothetical protein